MLTALADALSDDEVPHAVVETEMLVWAHPALTQEQSRQHVAALCALYRAAGHRLLLVAQTVETDADVARLLDAVDADGHVLVRLEAEPATLVKRILEREPPTWSGLPGLVEHAQRLAASMPALSGVDLVVSTEAQRPERVAELVRAAHPLHLRPLRPSRPQPAGQRDHDARDRPD